MKDTFMGAVKCIAIGVACYFMIQGLILTGVLARIPLLNDLFYGASNAFIVWISVFAAILVFAFQYLSSTARSLLSAFLILMLFFWFKEKLPGFWPAVTQMWDSLMSLFG